MKVVPFRRVIVKGSLGGSALSLPYPAWFRSRRKRGASGQFHILMGGVPKRGGACESMRLSPCVLVQPDGWARGEREGYGGPRDVTSLSLIHCILVTSVAAVPATNKREEQALRKARQVQPTARPPATTCASCRRCARPSPRGAGRGSRPLPRTGAAACGARAPRRARRRARGRAGPSCPCN